MFNIAKIKLMNNITLHLNFSEFLQEYARI